MTLITHLLRNSFSFQVTLDICIFFLQLLVLIATLILMTVIKTIKMSVCVMKMCFVRSFPLFFHSF